MSDPSTEQVPPGLIKLGERPPLPLYVSQLWQRRHFARTVAEGEMRAQHLDSLLGNLWHLLNPLLLIGVYYLVFGVVLGTDRGVDNFVAFLAIGIFCYTYTQKAAQSGAATLVDNEGLLRSLQFPRALLPISAVLRETFAFASALIVMFAVVLLTGEPFSFTWVYIVPALFLLLLFNAGLAFVFARLSDLVRDVLQVIPYVFRIFFYFSGILFSVDTFLPEIAEQLPGLPVHELFILNPFYVYISLPREYLMASVSHEFLGLIWLSALGWAVLLFAFGLILFLRGENQYGRG